MSNWRLVEVILEAQHSSIGNPFSKPLNPKMHSHTTYVMSERHIFLNIDFGTYVLIAHLQHV